MAITFVREIKNDLTMNPLWTGSLADYRETGVTGQFSTVTNQTKPIDYSHTVNTPLPSEGVPANLEFSNNQLPAPADLDPDPIVESQYSWGVWRVIAAIPAYPYTHDENDAIVPAVGYPTLYYTILAHKGRRSVRISGQWYVEEQVETGFTLCTKVTGGGGIYDEEGSYTTYGFVKKMAGRTINTPTVAPYAEWYNKPNYPYEMVWRGYLGLCQCAQGYDPDPYEGDYGRGLGIVFAVAFNTAGTTFPDNIGYFRDSAAYPNYIIAFRGNASGDNYTRTISFAPEYIDKSLLDLTVELEDAGIDDPTLSGVDYWLTTFEEYSREVGDPSTPGGYDPDGFGHLDDTSDSIGIPEEPSLGVSNLGMVHVYNCGSNSLRQLGALIFPDLEWETPEPIGSETDVIDAIIDGFNNLMATLANIPSAINVLMMNQLIAYIIDCHVLPVNPGSSTSEFLKIGFKEFTTLSLNTVLSDYYDFDCGSIRIGEYYSNFADYLGNAKLYLPFVGFVPCQPEWFTRSSLNVTYRFNVVDGSFICWVRGTGENVNNNNATYTILAQYGGNACIHLPITGANYSRMMSGIISGAAGAVGGAMSGNIAASATSAIGALSARGDIVQSNGYNASTSFLGCRRPFLLIERVLGSWSKAYAHEIGIPANITTTIGSVSGFVRSDDIHLDGIPATEAEKAMIAQALKEGIIV